MSEVTSTDCGDTLDVGLRADVVALGDVVERVGLLCGHAVQERSDQTEGVAGKRARHLIETSYEARPQRSSDRGALLYQLPAIHNTAEIAAKCSHVRVSAIGRVEQRKRGQLAAVTIARTARRSQVGADSRGLPRRTRRHKREAAACGAASAVARVKIGGRHGILSRQYGLAQVGDGLIRRAVVAHRRAGDRLGEVVVDGRLTGHTAQELCLSHTEHIGGRGRIAGQHRRGGVGGWGVLYVRGRFGCEGRRRVALPVVHSCRAIIARTHHHCHTQRRQRLQCRLSRNLIAARVVVPVRVAERVGVADNLRPRRVRQSCNLHQ